MHPGQCHDGDVATVMVVGGKSVLFGLRRTSITRCMLHGTLFRTEQGASCIERRTCMHACMEIYKQVLHYIFVVDTNFSILFDIIRNN